MNDYQVRFGGLFRLYGKTAMEKIAASSVCVIGLGGVGSWAAEALARCGVGKITIVDFDEICKSNVNRQLHALEGEFHRPKVEATAERLRKINPSCEIVAHQLFFTYSTADTILGTRFDYVIDAMDTPSKKCYLAHRCKELGLNLIITGAAGGKTDPTKVRLADLSMVNHDRLLQEVRKKLRVKYGFPRLPNPMNVEAVFSEEPTRSPILDGCENKTRRTSLDCKTGMGTAVFVTAVFGFVAASKVVNRIAGIIIDDLPEARETK
ncbi:MAG: tRNA threonylcarbamoyladenosine dehydratase [Verrucomicrobiae bacterium]|nr:tRNA threonylcarbamoyladenosine dehydratase [Verrucomicrobiae bacterium]